jgi:hypothetical protein
MPNHRLISTASRCDSLSSSDLQIAGTEVEAIALDSSTRHIFSGEHRQVLRKLYSAYETSLEEKFVRSFLIRKGKPRLESYLLWNRFCRLTDAEARGTRLSSAENIAFVGSGPFPISALQYARLRAVSVCCIDSNAEAVETSRKVISKLKLSNIISFQCVAGQDADFSKYDVVTVAALATPKLKILRRIAETIKPGARVACRTAFGNCDLIYERFSGPFPTSLSQYALHRSGFDDTISCRFLQRR